MTLYKSFDTAGFLFEQLWRQFPNIQTVKDGQNFIYKMITNSKEFCDFQKSNNFKIKYLSEGGFGIVGTVQMNEKKINGVVFSHGCKDNNGHFSVEIISKINRNPNNSSSIIRLNMNTISITDPLSDMVFGSVLGHLYDIGICPFVAKYFGTYMCSGTNNSTIMLEKADYEVLAFLNRTKQIHISPVELANLLCQYSYGLYLLKSYFGVVHFDTHLRNLMIKNTKISDYYIKGKNTKDIEYFLFETNVEENGHKLYVATKNSNLLLKIIDYGCMLMCFDRTKHPRFRRDLRIQTDPKNIDLIGATTALQKSRQNLSYANTVDYMFTLLNFYEFYDKNMDNSTKNKEQYLNIIETFFDSMFKLSAKDITSNSAYQIKAGDWFMRNHDSGLSSGYDSPNYLVDNLLNMCNKQISVNFEGKKIVAKLFSFDNINAASKLTEKNTVILTHNTSEYNMLFNRFEQLLSMEDKCNKYGTVYCKVYKQYNQSPKEQYSNDALIFEDNSSLKIMQKISEYDINPPYENYNLYMNNTPIPREKLTQKLENIQVTMITLKKYLKADIAVNSGLYDSPGISFPLGTGSIVEKKTIPYGFFANDNTLELFENYYPEEYNPYLGIICSDNKTFWLENYVNFLKRHKTEMTSICYMGENCTQVTKISTPIIVTSGQKYKWACTVGPMLVWNSEIVLTKDIVLNAKLNPDLKNSSMFLGKNPGFFYMSDCNEIQTQLVLIKRNNNIGLLLVEGGAFLSLGIDKINLAKMCKNLGVEYACCLYSGFSANILYNNKHQSVYLSKSPIKVIHSAVMSLTI